MELSRSVQLTTLGIFIAFEVAFINQFSISNQKIHPDISFVGP